MIDFQEPKLKARDERAVRKVLVDLQRRHPEKLLTAEDVVEEAKKSNSPLHAALAQPSPFADSSLHCDDARRQGGGQGAQVC